LLAQKCWNSFQSLENSNAPLPAATVACVPQKVNVDEVGETDFEIYPEEITDVVKVGLEEPIYP
jgi:hypothetical protein